MACLIVVAAALSMAFPSVAAAVTAQTALDGLNKLRSASGLPTVALDDAMSAGCDAHNSYMELNAVLSHTEDPQRPGYTPEGDNAGRNGILSSGGSRQVASDDPRWWASAWSHPWFLAPWHEAFVLHPAVARIGYADSHGFHCLNVAKRRAVADGETYSFPASGMTGVPLGGRTAEIPDPPQDVVGLPGDAVGFNIMLWHSRPGARRDAWWLDGGYDSAVVSATLTGPNGSRPVSVLPAGSAFNNRDVNIVVPHTPYKSHSRYTLDVVFDDGTPYRVAFTTGHFTPPSYEMVERAGNEIGVSVHGVPFYEDSGVIDGPVPEAVLTRPDGTTQSLANIALDPDSHGDHWRGNITVPGRYTVCATFGEELPYCQSLDTTKPHLLCTPDGSGYSCAKVAGSGRGQDATPSPATVRSALSRLLEQSPAYLAVARRGDLARQTFIAPGPGRLSLDLYLAQPNVTKASHHVRLAHANALVHAGGRRTIKVRLTKQGRIQMRRRSRLRVTARATFTPRGDKPTALSRTFTLTR